MAANGNGTKLGWGVALFLAGMVITGAGMVIRGDFLGSEAAEAVETRMTQRLDRELSYIRDQLREVKQLLRRKDKE